MDTLPLVDLLKINEIEAEILGGKGDVASVSRVLLDKGPHLCVVTLGPDGSYFRIVDGGDHVPPFKVATVDATGCGDAFIAALLCQLLDSLPTLSRGTGREAGWRDHLTVVRLRDVLRYANAAGALTSLTQGVIPALPTAPAVKAFLDEKAKL